MERLPWQVLAGVLASVIGYAPMLDQIKLPLREISWCSGPAIEQDGGPLASQLTCQALLT